MIDFEETIHDIKKRLNLKPGDIYESCSCHPVLCLGIDYRQDQIWGISLIDGSTHHRCSLVLCGVKKLTPKMAWKIKMCGPSDPDVRKLIPPERHWWNSNTEALAKPVRKSRIQKTAMV
jgi:hypothetical protein